MTDNGLNIETGELLPVITEQALPVVYEGMSTQPVSPEEQATLCAPPDPSQVDFKWGDREQTFALAYVAQVEYRRRLNVVFRPMGWAMRIIESKADGATVFVHAALYIRGVFVSQAWGKQEYIAANPNTDWATAQEGAKSDSLVRCCKDLGMFSELWDRTFTAPLEDEWRAKNRHVCPVCAKVLRPSKTKLGEWFCWRKTGGCGWEGALDGEAQSAAAESQVTPAERLQEKLDEIAGLSEGELEQHYGGEEARRRTISKALRAAFGEDGLIDIAAKIKERRGRFLQVRAALQKQAAEPKPEPEPEPEHEADPDEAEFQEILNTPNPEPPFYTLKEVEDQCLQTTDLEQIRFVRGSMAFHRTKYNREEMLALVERLNKRERELAGSDSEQEKQP